MITFFFIRLYLVSYWPIPNSQKLRFFYTFFRKIVRTIFNLFFIFQKNDVVFDTFCIQTNTTFSFLKDCVKPQFFISQCKYGHTPVGCIIPHHLLFNVVHTELDCFSFPIEFTWLLFARFVIITKTILPYCSLVLW